MKKLDDAVKRFGAPDHGRTAKRLRDFEAQLDAKSNGDFDHARMHEVFARGQITPCCEFMLLNGSCHVHGQRGIGNVLPDMPWPRNELGNDSLIQRTVRRRVLNETPEGCSDSVEKLQATVVHQRDTIAALQKLLNRRDEQIERLKHRPKNWKFELLFTGFCLCVMAAYAWWKFHYA